MYHIFPPKKTRGKIQEHNAKSFCICIMIFFIIIQNPSNILANLFYSIILSLSSDRRIIFGYKILDSMHKMSAYSFGNHLEQIPILWHDQFSPREKWECKKSCLFAKMVAGALPHWLIFFCCHICNIKLCVGKYFRIYFEYYDMITLPPLLFVCGSLFSHKSHFFFCYQKKVARREFKTFIVHIF